jgi:hypothetical protein
MQRYPKIDALFCDYLDIYNKVILHNIAQRTYTQFKYFNAADKITILILNLPFKFLYYYKFRITYSFIKIDWSLIT